MPFSVPFLVIFFKLAKHDFSFSNQIISLTKSCLSSKTQLYPAFNV
mgnify:CR=1 FL=1